MPYVDPDNADPALVEELIKMYQTSGDRLRKIILNPPGSSASSQEFNHARASQLQSQVQAEVNRLKQNAAAWTGKAMNKSLAKGITVGEKQIKDALKNADLPPDSPLKGSFSQVNHAAVQALARDTVGDCFKAADSMNHVASSALRQMAATGVTKSEVNRILAGGIIEGKPVQAVRELRDALKKVHGNQVTIQMSNGGSRTFDTGYYAEIVARSKMREATVTARHHTLTSHGIDLVTVVGARSVNPCTNLLGKVFSLSGRSPKHPAWSTVSRGQLPYRLFHPNCTKSTTPYIEDLAGDAGASEEKAAT